jgi:HEAT repeat protein
VLAAEALGAIGGARAIAALTAVLVAGDLRALPPPLRLSEEAVRSCVARELGRAGATDARGALLDALHRFHLVDAGTVLARFGDRRAVPDLVDCLDDAFLRERAAVPLREFGPVAVDTLLAGLTRRVVQHGAEARWSVERRAACARLLGEIGDPGADSALTRALADETREVRVAAAVALSRLGCGDVPGVVSALVEGLRSEDRLAVDDCEGALVSLGPPAVSGILDVLAHEVDRMGAARERVPSSVVLALARALRRIGAPGVHALVSLARHGNPLARGVVVANLGHSESPVAGSVVTRALRDADARVRRTARAVLLAHCRPTQQP